MESVLRIPCEYIPDPRTVIEDAQDKEKQERDNAERLRRIEEEKKVKKAVQMAKEAEREKQRAEKNNMDKDGDEEGSQDDSMGSGDPSKKSSKTGEQDSNMSPSQKGSKFAKSGEGSHRDSSRDKGDSMSGSDQDDDQDGSDLDDEDMDDIEGLHSGQPDMKNEIIATIEDEIREHEHLKRTNEDLQRQILMMDNITDQYDKQQDMQMNEHKYLNTLANVHQVRFNLKET